MENNYRAPKRPRGCAKPYWGKAGNLFIALLASVGICFVGSFFNLLLDAILPISPLWQRVTSLVISLLCSGGTVICFSYQEGYNRRGFSLWVTVWGGVLYLLIHTAVSLVLSTPYVAGYVATDLASILFYGNTAYALDSLPPLLVMLCALAADAAVYVPLYAVGERWGAAVYAADVRELQQEHESKL